MLGTKSRLIYLLSVISLFLPLTSFADPPLMDTVLISEIQTGSTTLTSEEFVELYNATDTPIDLTGWKVQKFAGEISDFDIATKTTLELAGILLPGKYYLLSSTGFVVGANQYFSSMLAKTGGHIRLLSPDSVVEGFEIERDLVGWGTASLPEGLATPAPNGGQSLVRKLDVDGHLIDTGDNSQDFEISASPTPQADPIGAPAEEPPPDPPDEPTVEEDAPETPEPEVVAETDAPLTVAPDPSLPIQITELLPNPATPISDAEGEFVELYNPNPEPVDISGYKLQTGNSYSYSHTFEGTILQPNSYAAFFVTITDVLLSNSSGRARLLDAGGEVDSETPVYDTAKDDQSWSLIDNVWRWSTVMTPNEANVFGDPTVLPDAKAASAKAKAKPKAKKATSTKKASATKASAAVRAAYDEPEPTEANTPVDIGMLAGVGGVTLLYTAYEYKQDMSGRFRQLRRYREIRRATRQKP